MQRIMDCYVTKNENKEKYIACRDDYFTCLHN